jgi:hypothetical protein
METTRTVHVGPSPSCSCRAAPALGAAPLRGEADRASGVRSPRARRLLHRAFARASGTAFARERSARVSEMNAVVSDRTNACERERRSRIGRKTSEKHPANFSISAAKFARATPDAVLRRRVLFILRLHTEKPIPRFWFFLKRARVVRTRNIAADDFITRPPVSNSPFKPA